MPTLRVVLDQVLAPVPGGIGRYTEELTRALIATAPAGWQVSGLVARHPGPELARLDALLPGLESTRMNSLPRRALSLAWQYGVIAPGDRGIVHSPSLFAPMFRHQSGGDQQVVATIHDAVPWTHPQTLTPRGVRFHRAMAQRAERYADAVIVPTAAVADELGGILRLGDRIRVVGSAVSSALALPANADERARQLGLPERYLLAVGTLEPRKGLGALVRALAEPGVPSLPLLVVGPAGWGGVDLEGVATSAGLAPDRVRSLGRLSDSDLAVALDRAAVFVMPSLAEGFGIPVIEAMQFGTPVVHSDAPALVEVAGGSGLTVPIGDPASYPARLATALASVVDDDALATQLRAAGPARAAAFSWTASAEKVWQLHADL